MKELKACPFCGGKATRIGDEVSCIECFASTGESCTPVSDWNKRAYQKRIEELEAKLETMSHVAKELHSVISEYSAMPCKSLMSRMVKTAIRYESKIFNSENK